ncbi:MAG TPA: hypothetical protein VGI29_00665 [Candidatus Binataceae bacterium]
MTFQSGLVLLAGAQKKKANIIFICANRRIDHRAGNAARDEVRPSITRVWI